MSHMMALLLTSRQWWTTFLVHNNKAKFRTVTYFEISLDPPALKARSNGASDAAKRMIGHHLAANNRGGQRQSGHRDMKDIPGDRRSVLLEKRRREKKSGEEDGPKEKSARLEDGPKEKSARLEAVQGSGGSGGPGLTRQGKGDQTSGANIFNFTFNYN